MRYDTMNDTINHFIATAPWNPIHCRDFVTQVSYVYKKQSPASKCLQAFVKASWSFLWTGYCKKKKKKLHISSWNKMLLKLLEEWFMFTLISLQRKKKMSLGIFSALVPIGRIWGSWPALHSIHPCHIPFSDESVDLTDPKSWEWPNFSISPFLFLPLKIPLVLPIATLFS